MTTEKYHNGYDPQVGDHVIDPGAFRGTVLELEGNEALVRYSDSTTDRWAVWDLDLASDGLAQRAQTGFDLWKRMREP